MSMCRIGSARSAPILLVMALFVFSLGIVPPTTAWASDGEEEQTGFMSGLTTLVHPEEVQQYEVNPQDEFMNDYEPVLRDAEPAVLDEDATTQDWIESVTAACNTVRWGTGGNPHDLLWSARNFFTSASYTGVGVNLMVVVSGIAFMWWGVRKSLRMIKAAWKSGKISA